MGACAARRVETLHRGVLHRGARGHAADRLGIAAAPRIEIQKRIQIPFYSTNARGNQALVYFLRHNFEVFAVDSNPQSIQQVRLLAAKLAPKLSSQNFLNADVAEMPLPGEKFDPLMPRLERPDAAAANQMRWLISTSGPTADLNILFGTLNDFPVPATPRYMP